MTDWVREQFDDLAEKSLLLDATQDPITKDLRRGWVSLFADEEHDRQCDPYSMFAGAVIALKGVGQSMVSLGYTFEQVVWATEFVARCLAEMAAQIKDTGTLARVPDDVIESAFLHAELQIRERIARTKEQGDG